MQPKRQGKLDFGSSPRKGVQAHGDWRIPLEHPEEVEHWKPVRKKSIAEWSAALQAMPAAPILRSAAEDEWRITGWQQFLRLLFSCGVMLPLSITMVFALLVQLYHAAPTMERMSFWLTEPVWFTLMGVLTMAALKLSLVADRVLLYAYVLGHELTHAIAAKLSGGKLHGFRVDENGGYVETDADNVFIALSPYFVPLWMLCWLGALWLVNAVFPFEDYAPWFYAGFGFWWAFHLYWTAWIIPREQPDMLNNGVVFSALLILIMNLLVLLAVLRSFGVVSLQGYAHDWLRCAGEVYGLFADVALWLWQAGQIVAEHV